MGSGSFVARSNNRWRALALIAALSLVSSLLVQFGVSGSTLAPAFGAHDLNLTIDADGPDDVPAQTDVSLLGFDDSHLPDYYVVQIQFDDTTYPGGNTGDGCVFFDSDDAGGFADFAVCGSFQTNTTTSQVELVAAALYDCKNNEPNNDEGKRCPFTGGGGDGSSGIIAQDLDGDGVFESDGDGNPLGTPYDTMCSLNTTSADPFNGVGTHNTSGEQDPIFDTQLTCDILADELVELNGDVPSGVAVSNACSFTSPDPGSESKDCVADAGSGFLRIIKNAAGGDATFDYTVDGEPFESITTVGGVGETDNVPVAGGQQIALAEDVPAGWQLDSATCDNGDDPAALTIDAAQTVTCAFNNSVAFVPNPSFTIDKQAAIADGGASIDEAGDVIDYTITLTNTGNQGLTDVTVTDPLLGGAIVGPDSGDDDGDGVLDADETVDNFDSDGDGKLDTGEVWIYTGSYVVQQTELDDNGGGDGFIDNTATAGTNETDPQDASASVPISQVPGLGVEKVLTSSADEDGSGTVSVDDTLTYTITATNTGNVTLTSVSVLDDLTGDATLCGSVAPGDTCVLVVAYVVTQADVDAGQIDNIGTADSDQTDPVEDPEQVDVPQSPAIEVVKAGAWNDLNSDGVAQENETITYSFVVTNIGDVTLTDVSVTDPILDNVVCEATTLAPGASTECESEFDYFLFQSDVDAGEKENTATVTGSGPQGQPVTDNDTIIVPLPSDADLSLVKSLDGNADEDGNGTVSVGDTLTYAFVATNAGNVTLTGVSITDPLPGLSVLTCDPSEPAELAPGEALTCTAEYVVTQADADGGSIVNTATADSDQTEPVEDSEQVLITQNADLDLVKAFKDDQVTVGGSPSSFELVVTNTGDVTLTDVVVTDSVNGLLTVTGVDCGGGTSVAVSQNVACTFDSLPAGDSRTITVSFEVVPGAASTGAAATAVPTAAFASLISAETECPPGYEPNPDGVCTSMSIRPVASCWESDGTQLIEITNIQRYNITVDWLFDGQSGTIVVPRRGSTFVTITGGPVSGQFDVLWSRSEHWWIEVGDLLCDPPDEFEVVNTASAVAAGPVDGVSAEASDTVIVVGTSGELGEPVADFEWTCEDTLECTFTDLSTDDGTIVSWDWDFGDSNTSTDQNPVHTYDEGGTYPVTLTVTDDDSLTDSITFDVSVFGPIEGTMHVADLDGVGVSTGRMWDAIVTITVVDDGGSPVNGAVVTGDWNRRGTGTCTTDASGTCMVEAFGNRLSTEVFTVSNVSFPTLIYDPSSNSDPDGDSDGTTIVISRP